MGCGKSRSHCCHLSFTAGQMSGVAQTPALCRQTWGPHLTVENPCRHSSTGPGLRDSVPNTRCCCCCCVSCEQQLRSSSSLSVVLFRVLVIVSEMALITAE